jgi:hypothetical protein
MEGSFSLWEEYVAQAEETLARLENARQVVKYESFLADPKPHLLDLLRFCELEESRQEILDDVARCVDVTRSSAFGANPGLLAFYDRVKNNRWMSHYGYGSQ